MKILFLKAKFQAKGSRGNTWISLILLTSKLLQSRRTFTMNLWLDLFLYSILLASLLNQPPQQSNKFSFFVYYYYNIFSRPSYWLSYLAGISLAHQCAATPLRGARWYYSLWGLILLLSPYCSLPTNNILFASINDGMLFYCLMRILCLRTASNKFVVYAPDDLARGCGTAPYALILCIAWLAASHILAFLWAWLAIYAQLVIII